VQGLFELVDLPDWTQSCYYHWMGIKIRHYYLPGTTVPGHAHLAALVHFAIVGISASNAINMISFDVIAFMCAVSSAASQHEQVCVLFGIVPNDSGLCKVKPWASP
jgi:hypothetical protein